MYDCGDAVPAHPPVGTPTGSCHRQDRKRSTGVHDLVSQLTVDPSKPQCCVKLMSSDARLPNVERLVDALLARRQKTVSFLYIAVVKTTILGSTEQGTLFGHPLPSKRGVAGIHLPVGLMPGRRTGSMVPSTYSEESDNPRPYNLMVQSSDSWRSTSGPTFLKGRRLPI